MVDTLDRQGPDFLEARQAPNTDNDITSLAFSSRVLLEILREIRKSHASQRCVLDLQFSNPLKILDSAADIVDIRFLAQGKRVLSQYLTVTNNTDVAINVGLNESVVENAALTFASGIRVAGGATVQIPIEIENIQIRLTSNTVARGIVINNGNAGVGIPANGTVQVYSWTIPLSDKDDTE